MADVLEFVRIYRLFGCPSLKTGNSFCFQSSVYRDELADAVLRLAESKTGRFDELLIDGEEAKPQDLALAKSWSTIELSYVIDASGAVPVFKNIEQLMARSKSYVRQSLPPHFYLLEDDILSSDTPTHPQVKSLQDICRLIVCLADLAHFHDEKDSSDEYKLVFVADDLGKGERAVTLYPYLDASLLSCELGVTLIDSLQSSNMDVNPHLVKERAIFRASLIEHLVGCHDGKERFKFLVANWRAFIELYENNLSTYLSGFSFHKVKQEIATTQITIADQMSKVVGDISGKILSVPISLVAVIAIVKAESALESTILVAGLTITSALLAETLSAQRLQYDRISHSRGMMFSDHFSVSRQYPADLRKCLDDAVSALNDNERKLKRSLLTLRVVCWVPAVAATALHSFIYQDALIQGAKKILKSLLLAVC
ncbi:hypothetical protein HU761_23930 [Pseudomonas sp. SWRI59]|uniref:hypothetical protein n=1 Tax=unclassified Pseudomonas TaxID=196821 RepID=UPI0016471EE1|nr:MULTISPECIES: hypothetical protein [unclassified Pseudomonas]MBC3504435.1 hypothetical protein [Pseudomonas sp. SWRI59]MBC3509749.1 hypothetical protein [Pseudomonas sp. SWRI68]